MHLRVLVVLTLLLIASCRTSSPPSTLGSPSPTPGSSASSVSPVLQANSSPATPSSTAARVDACALLTTEEIESIQGEAIKETNLSGSSDSGLDVSQCFFTLPTFTNSVSLLVAQKGDGPGAREPKDFWRDTFHQAESKEKNRGGEKEKEGTPPRKISGIGDEAFWMGSTVGGALYVLKGNAYVRVSVGGPADQAGKIRKSRALAQKALARVH